MPERDHQQERAHCQRPARQANAQVVVQPDPMRPEAVCRRKVDERPEGQRCGSDGHVVFISAARRAEMRRLRYTAAMDQADLTEEQCQRLREALGPARGRG